jgi:hypothetical protein
MVSRAGGEARGRRRLGQGAVAMSARNSAKCHG